MGIGKNEVKQEIHISVNWAKIPNETVHNTPVLPEFQCKIDTKSWFILTNQYKATLENNLLEFH